MYRNKPVRVSAYFIVTFTQKNSENALSFVSRHSNMENR